MGYIDLHCDSLLRIYNKYEQDDLLENDQLSVYFKGLNAGGALAQFFAVFMPDQTALEELNLKNIGGESVLALGSDFDGIKGDLEISRSSKMPLLFKALKNYGWNYDLIDKFKSENIKRVIKEVLN